jgi:hypothetical protein
MDMIILTDGMYHLVPVTKELLENVRLYNSAGEMDFFDLCEKGSNESGASYVSTCTESVGAE